MRLWHISALFVTAVGCNAVLGLEERPERTERSGVGGSGSAATGGMGGTSCHGAECFEPAPDGWSGPLIVSRGDDPPACTVGSELFLGYGELADPTHTCPCTCGAATGVTCTITVRAFSDQNCVNLDQTEVFNSPGDCRHLDRDPQSTTYEQAANTASASCAAAVAEPIIPPIAWGTNARGCFPIDALEEMPAGFEACIQQAGDVPCPGDFYTDRTVLYDGVDDTRACMTDCSCGAVSTADCGAFVQSYTGHTCNENVHETPPTPGCAFAFFDSTQLISWAPTGTCEPVDATATGAATPTGEFTVCCHLN